MARGILPRGPRQSPRPGLVATLSAAVLLLHSLATDLPQVAEAWGMFSIFAEKTDTAPEAPDALSCVEGTICESKGGMGDGEFSLGVNSSDLGMAQASTHYFYGKFSVNLKGERGYTGGTLLAFYLVAPGSNSNKDLNHSEVDMELYGSEDGRRVVLATNVFTGGYQNLAQMNLEVDPSAHFHTFTIQWNSRFICWYVNGVPHRVLYRDWDKPWPARPMKAVVSLWDTSSFTTLKSNYSNGPVTALVQGYTSQGCAIPEDQVLDPDHGQGTCPTWTNPKLPWNAPLSVGDALKLAALRRHRLINDFGWDMA